MTKQRKVTAKNRDFKGVWIPSTFWLNPNLSVMDILFLTEIDSLQRGDQGCYASNNHFADFFGVSSARCSQIITSLVKRNYLLATYDKRETGEVLKRHLWVVNKLSTPTKNIKGGT